MPGYVSAALRLVDVRDLAPAVARCRRLLDLDADPVAVDETLAGDPALGPSVHKEPGIRVPRAVDGFEIAVRAIVGQQISVAGARTVLGRLTALIPRSPAVAEPPGPTVGGGPWLRAVGHRPTEPTDSTETIDPTDPANQVDPVGMLVPFPDAASVAGAPDGAFGMPAARRATIRTLAAAVASGELRLGEGADRAETEAALRAIPGIGGWTAGYVAMRALGDPDVFLPTDLAVRRGAARLGLPDANTLDEHARRWRPWRSYAVIRLWRH
jgi:AraC family transcriptional regulator of adaptative response / DNA-3-methyladenine glycosylase II